MTRTNHRHWTPGAAQRIVVFRALKLGDLLCAVPAFRSIRAALPSARITLIGLPWARSFVERFDRYIDDFVEFPGYPGLSEIPPKVDRFPQFVCEVQSRRFDWAIQLHGSGSIVNPLVMLFGARHTAGFYVPGEYCPDEETFLRWPTDGREVRRLLALTDFLGMPACGEHLEFTSRPGDFESLPAEASILRAGEFVCIHPGASVPERRWPAECFAAVADELSRHYAVVITGTESERELARVVERHMAAPALNLAGRTTLGSLAALIGRARLLVCNDTGVSHLADALRTPSVIISTGNNPARWAPADVDRHRIVNQSAGASVSDVVQQAQKLLGVAAQSAPVSSRLHGRKIHSARSRRPAMCTANSRE